MKSHLGVAIPLLVVGVTLVAVSGRMGSSPETEPVASPGVAASTARAQATQRLEILVARASAAYNRGQITAPAGEGAMELFLAVREQAPGNAVATEALAEMLPLAADTARAALGRADNDEARRILGLMERAAPESHATRSVRSELDSLRARPAVAGASASEPSARLGGSVSRSVSER
jgi:protein TonB